MTGVKSYLHKYVEQPGPKVVFGDNSSCITEGYGSINCGSIIFTKVAFVNGLKYNLISISQLCDAKCIVQFDDKQGTIFNANEEIVLIAPRRNDVYVLDMSSLTLNGACFFAKASKSINWLWHIRLSHLNFKNINKLAKQNKVLSLHSLVYSKDKPCSACEKGKHHRASLKTKQNFSIRKCLHLLHMDLFGPISPMSINHEKMVENQNDVKVKQIRTDNGTEFRNHELESFCDERGISQNLSSPYTPEQNGVAERKNRTLIEAARTMLNGSVLSKHFLTEAVRIACYTQNRSIIVKRYDKTPYEILRERIFDISYFHVFGCPVFIHNHKDHLGKFDAKADDGYFLGYSFIGIDDSSRYPPDEFVHEDDPSRQYQIDSDISYYVIPHGRSLSELTQENQVLEVIAPNEPDIPHTEDTEGNNTEVSGSITKSLVLDVTQSLISNQASTIMLTRSMTAKHTVASASECLFVDFLSEIKPKKASKALKHPGWVDAIQEELNQNKKDEHGITTKNKARLVAQGYSQEEGIDYDETFTPVSRMEAIRIFLAFAIYMNFKVYQMNVKSVFLNALYGLKQAPRTCTSGLQYQQLVLHSRTKHSDIRYHFIRDYILKEDIELHFIHIEYQLADIFTKPLDEPTFTRLKAELGMLNID
ncbi:retrovirus-related pol polyprotein from transposon TNT 1-94 [Tanacetum coccineum]